MNIKKGFAICKNCDFSTLNFCKKYNKECLSISIEGQREQLNCLDCLNNDSYISTKNKENKIENTNIGYFHVPNHYFLKIYAIYNFLLNKYPDAFYTNRKIIEIYGNFAGSLWNGRTPDYGQRLLHNNNIKYIKNKIEDLNLNFNITFNNHLINEKDLDDPMSNMIASIFHTGNHAITVSSPILFDYLKTKYPNYKFYYSAISTENINLLDNQDLFLKYDKILWPRKDNNNWEEINKIPLNNKSQIEFLCNDICTPFCNRIIHYDLINKELKNKTYESEFKFLNKYCTIDHDFLFFNSKRWPITITPDCIDTYINNGFSHFKLCSRNDKDIVFIYKLYSYLVKPEFFEDMYFITLDLLNSSFLNEFEVMN